VAWSCTAEPWSRGGPRRETPGTMPMRARVATKANATANLEKKRPHHLEICLAPSDPHSI
jgi:hypothetical protein